MDALIVTKNDNRELSVELLPTSGVSFYILWIPNPKRKLIVEVGRSIDGGSHTWNPLELIAGDRISFQTCTSVKVDRPIALVTRKEIDLGGSGTTTMKPRKLKRLQFQDIGDLEFLINGKQVITSRLDTGNQFMPSFIWLGDRTGNAVIRIGSQVPKLRRPRIKFGDELTFIFHRMKKQMRLNT